MEKLEQEKSIEKDGMKSVLKELEYLGEREKENSQRLVQEDMQDELLIEQQKN